MRKIFLSIALFMAILAGSFGGVGSTQTASAAVSFISWPKDVIYVYDTTASVKNKDGSPVWPVRAAAATWSKGNPVEFRYTTKGCPANTQCVTVKQAKLKAPAAGTTTTTFVGADIRSSNVALDKAFGSKNSAAKRRNVVCHELGHSLGIKHRTQTSTCMTSYVTSQKTPDKTDIKNLKTMYGYR